MVEVCSKCHPYFTGSVKFVDAAGRVDKFNKKFQGTYGKGKKRRRRRGRQDLAADRSNDVRRTARGRTIAESARGPFSFVSGSGSSSAARGCQSGSLEAASSAVV